MERAVVPLPHGFLSDGSLVQRAEVRELNGHDEEFLEKIEDQSPSGRTTALLERVVSFSRDDAREVHEIVRRLTVGDRVALMLGLRTLMFGDKLDCTVSCPDCSNEMSVELSASGLIQHPVGGAEAEETGVEVEGFKLRLRPVTGADLEELDLPEAKQDPRERLVRACVVSSEPELPPRIPDELVTGISSRLADLDPQADIVLDLSCPHCGHPFETPFFIEDFLAREMRSRRAQLEKEVHWIAFNYHWSEGEILSLPANKRKRYVGLINRTLSGEAL